MGYLEELARKLQPEIELIVYKEKPPIIEFAKDYIIVNHSGKTPVYVFDNGVFKPHKGKHPNTRYSIIKGEREIKLDEEKIIEISALERLVANLQQMPMLSYVNEEGIIEHWLFVPVIASYNDKVPVYEKERFEETLRFPRLAGATRGHPVIEYVTVNPEPLIAYLERKANHLDGKKRKGDYRRVIEALEKPLKIAYLLPEIENPEVRV